MKRDEERSDELEHNVNSAYVPETTPIHADIYNCRILTNTLCNPFFQALFGESRDLEAEAQAEAKAKIMAQVSEGVAKEAPRRLSFKGTSSAAGVSAVRGISLKDGAMDFGVDTPVEVLAALASLHSDEDGGKARRRRRDRRRRSL